MMFAPFTWLFSPVYRWAAAVGSFVTFVALVWWNGRKRGIEKIQNEQAAERDRRSKSALQADNTVRRDIASGRLYENDGHRRD
jgi:uncharacterized membrane protein